MERTGIYFEENKKDLLADKLSERVIERGFNSFLDYYYLLKYDDQYGDEWETVLDRITVKETYFWREFDQVECLMNYILPDFAGHNSGKTFRIWSAACSTGEEPYTILMALDSEGWLKKIRLEMIASDASRQAVNTAKAGLFRERSMKFVPDNIKTRYFRKDGDHWSISPALKNIIKWNVINLANESQRTSVQACNVIFCRNVFIYFREETISKIVESFFSQLLSPGFLFTGVSESLFRIKNSFELSEMGKTFVYKKHI